MEIICKTVDEFINRAKELKTKFKIIKFDDNELYSKLIKYCEKNGESDPDLFTIIGLLYSYAKGVSKDYCEAFRWYLKAANLNSLWGINCLAYSYYHGKGIVKNYKKAVEWYTKAAEQGDADAQKAIAKDNPRAMYSLGLCYDVGCETSKGFIKKAIEWETNHCFGCYEVPRDVKKAIECYTKAAEQGYVDAQVRLGVCYEDGKSYWGSTGMPLDYKKAVEWYTKAAEQGDAEAQNSLGCCYEDGKGVPQDYKKAVEWYTKAAEQGDVYALLNLGTCYENGNGVNQDYEKALKLYIKSATKCEYYGDEEEVIENLSRLCKKLGLSL